MIAKKVLTTREKVLHAISAMHQNIKIENLKDEIPQSRTSTSANYGPAWISDNRSTPILLSVAERSMEVEGILNPDLQKTSGQNCRFLNKRQGRLIEKMRYARTFWAF